jgi:hypothetical protein
LAVPSQAATGQGGGFNPWLASGARRVVGRASRVPLGIAFCANLGAMACQGGGGHDAILRAHCPTLELEGREFIYQSLFYWMRATGIGALRCTQQSCARRRDRSAQAAHRALTRLMTATYGCMIQELGPFMDVNLDCIRWGSWAMNVHP